MPRMAADHVRQHYGVRKGAWSEEEDALLRECIDKYGEGKWHQVPLKAGLNRCRKSCRLRWLNYLKPNIKRGEFSLDEADLIIRLHKLLGNRWSLIAGRLTGRTANDVKNYWNTHLHKKAMLGLQAVMNPALAHAAADYQTKVIKPRPRTISKTLVQCMRSRQQQQQGQNFCSSSTTKDDAVDLISTKADAAADEQIQWWKSLLNDQLSDQEVAPLLPSGFCGMEMEEEQAGYGLAQSPKGDSSGYKICEEWPTTGFTSELSFDIELWDFLTDDQWQLEGGLHQDL